MTRLTLHLVPEEVWAARDPDEPYLPAAYADDGFVHCSDGHETVIDVANRYYRHDPRPFLLLTIDLDATGSPWRFDDPARQYPHVYGPIDPRSVVEVVPMRREPDGRFLGPPLT